jgi:phosphoglucosamine mutase
MTSKPRLFGTDGIRGVAGRYPLDRETVGRIGRALGIFLNNTAPSRPAQVVLGEDTRESSPWISRALAGGLRAGGAEVDYAGVITTPGVAYLARQHGFAAGVMVSASHNPYRDNGIKVISHEGMKLAETLEVEIEAILSEVGPLDHNFLDTDLKPDPQMLRDFVEFLVRLVRAGDDLTKYRVVIDCSHGAASRVIPEVMRRLEIETRVINAQPNGRNINLRCGSLHPEAMAAETKSWGADLGVAFDGDADRAIFATHGGRLTDGDHILYAAATHLDRRGALKGRAVVGTLMTNLGLEVALAHHGIALRRTAVGDKFVLEEMLRSGINLGGEPSGHIIFSDIAPAGDGIITLLQVLQLMAETGESLESLIRPLKQFPQIILNVPVTEKLPLDSIPSVAHAISTSREEFGDQGRVVVRYSGTEPLARVMVEAEDSGAVRRHAERIAAAIASALGPK